MKRSVLILGIGVVLFFCIVSKTWAENEILTSGTCNDAGTCLWSLSSDGIMNISAAINPVQEKRMKM